MIYLDTHALIYLYTGEQEQFTQSGLNRLLAEDICASGMAVLELTYLYEVGRLSVEPDDMIEILMRDCQLTICDAPFAKIIKIAQGLSWTRDPFDRLIVANALFKDTALLTKDQMILNHCNLAFW